MSKEKFYGNDGDPAWHDDNASDLSATATFSPQEDGSASQEAPQLDIHNAGSRFHKYLFYFSSKL